MSSVGGGEVCLKIKQQVQNSFRGAGSLSARVGEWAYCRGGWVQNT